MVAREQGRKMMRGALQAIEETGIDVQHLQAIFIKMVVTFIYFFGFSRNTSFFPSSHSKKKKGDQLSELELKAEGDWGGTVEALTESLAKSLNGAPTILELVESLVGTSSSVNSAALLHCFGSLFAVVACATDMWSNKQAQAAYDKTRQNHAVLTVTKKKNLNNRNLHCKCRG